MICQLTSILSGSPDLCFFNIKPLTNAADRAWPLTFWEGRTCYQGSCLSLYKRPGQKMQQACNFNFFFLKHLKDFKCQRVCFQNAYVTCYTLTTGLFFTPNNPASSLGAGSWYRQQTGCKQDWKRNSTSGCLLYSKDRKKAACLQLAGKNASDSNPQCSPLQKNPRNKKTPLCDTVHNCL